MTEEKTTWGGARAGAGRKALDGKMRSLRMTDKDLYSISFFNGKILRIACTSFFYGGRLSSITCEEGLT